jgi:molybdopterin molybdotransferase
VDPDCLPVETARRRILEDIEPLRESEAVALRAAIGRVLAQDVRAPIDVPPQTNSAMDGYAMRGIDLDDRGAAELRPVGEAFAGRPYAGPVGEGECVRIMTGAPMPPNCDTVVMQEQTQARPETGDVLLARGSARGRTSAKPARTSPAARWPCPPAAG